MSNDTLTPQFWETRYQDGTTRWDLGQAAPSLLHWLQGQTPQGERVLVLGCGRGHDARALAQAGYRVMGVDYAPSAIAEARTLTAGTGLEIDWLQRDIFALLPDYAGQFDYVVEHTCFCALDPSLRDAYGSLVRDLLKPRGTLVGIFFTHDRPGGPPYGSTPEDIRQCFNPHFTLTALTPAPQSPPSRQGQEHWGLFQRR